jgi:hypothetical protein
MIEPQNQNVHTTQANAQTQDRSQTQDRCIYCFGKEITKKGTRKKKFETVQLWYCKTCEQVFTPNAAKGKTYPIPVIIEGLNYLALRVIEWVISTSLFR